MGVPVLADGGMMPYFPTWSVPDGYHCGVLGDTEKWPSWPAPGITDTAVPAVKDVLKEANGTIDPEKVWVSGLSEGAAGAIVAALAYPDIFQLAIASSVNTCRNYTDAALAGEKRLAEDPSRKRRLKTLIFSRGMDDVWPFCTGHDGMERFAKLIDEDKAAHVMKHYSVEVRWYHNVGHECWIWDWAKTMEYHMGLWKANCPLEKCILSMRLDSLLPPNGTVQKSELASIPSVPAAYINTSGYAVLVLMVPFLIGTCAAMVRRGTFRVSPPQGSTMLTSDE